MKKLILLIIGFGLTMNGQGLQIDTCVHKVTRTPVGAVLVYQNGILQTLGKDYTATGTMPIINPTLFSIGDKMSVVFSRATPLKFTYQGQDVSYWGYSTWREDWVCVEGNRPPVAPDLGVWEIGIGYGVGNMFTGSYPILAGENLNTTDLLLVGVTCRANILGQVVDVLSQNDAGVWISVLPSPLPCGSPGRTEIPVIPGSLLLRGNVLMFKFILNDYVDPSGVHATPSQISATITYQSPVLSKGIAPR